MPDVALEIRSLSKQFFKGLRGSVEVVKRLNLTVPKGQILGFLGPNGAGKTTTIKMICGLVTPTKGVIRVNGFDVRRQRQRAMGQIGAVLEGARNIYWRLTAWQNLIYFGKMKGIFGSYLEKRAQQLLEELDLWDVRHDPVRFFSRGMQQKVAVACALIADPPIVLLDEPTLGLDTKATRAIEGWIEDLTHKQQKTVLLTMHQLDIAEKVCDRVAFINKGQLIANQTIDEWLRLLPRDRYQVRLKGKIAKTELQKYTAWGITHDGSDTLLTGKISDQQTLLQLLQALHTHRFRILSFQLLEPSLEDIFIALTEETQGENATHRPLQ